MKEAHKNSLLNYFPKKKSSDVQSNAENRKGETKVKEKQKMIKETETKEGGKPKENQSSCTKGKPMFEGRRSEIKSSKNPPQKTLTKRKRKDEVDDTDEEDGDSRRRKFKALSKEVRAAIAIAQLMELSDDGDADDESDAGVLKGKKSKASSGVVKQDKKPAKSTKKQNGTFKSTVESPKCKIPTEMNAKEKERALETTKESTSSPKKNKESNPAENFDEKCTEGENAKKIQSKKKTEQRPKKIAHSVKVGERPKKDISSFFTKLKKRD